VCLVLGRGGQHGQGDLRQIGSVGVVATRSRTW
jgi:hypothetical protein